MISPCPECGLHYVPTSSDDRRIHRKWHDESVNGLRRKPHRTDEIVYASALDRVLVITPKSPLVQRRRAQDTSLVMARDVPFSFVAYHRDEEPDERDLHIFLGSRSDRLVAYLALERRQNIWRCTWPEYEHYEFRKVTDRSWMWSVGVAWVSRKNRHQGWIRRVIAAASMHLEIPPGEYGWHAPFSDDGKAMVRSIHPATFYIAN